MVFITFEGIDYSGKTTQAKLLYNYLKSGKKKVILLREPGGTKISEKIRAILLDRKHLEMTPLTEFLLFSAARSQLVSEIIWKYLQKNYIVICDRFYDSSTAYQGFGGKLDIRKIYEVNNFASGGIKPDLTFLINLSPEIAFLRQASRNNSKDRMENKDLSFYKRVYKGFNEIANNNKKRFVVIDGSISIKEIQSIIIKTVNNKLKP